MYRENISQFLKEGKKLLFIPKNGGLNQYVRDLLPEIGIDLGKKERRNDGLELLLARGEDIPQRVLELTKMGKPAYGLTGDDLYDELILQSNCDSIQLLNTYDWFDDRAEYKRPALCLLNPSGRWQDIPKQARVAVNRKYKEQSKSFLLVRSAPQEREFIINTYSGDTEATVACGANDCCIDIVYGGETRKMNNLHVAEVIRFSDIALIGPAEPRNVWQQEYQRILTRKTNRGDSYTSKLLNSDNEIVKKIGQEAAELCAAFVNGQNLAGEALDVFYATMTALASRGIGWDQVEEKLMKRWTP